MNTCIDANGWVLIIGAIGGMITAVAIPIITILQILQGRKINAIDTNVNASAIVSDSNHQKLTVLQQDTGVIKGAVTGGPIP